jgi:hypothetical protein
MGVQIQMNIKQHICCNWSAICQTGGAIAPTNTNGTVIAASYTGTYTNVVTVGNVITTQCQSSNCCWR